jgi:hypothetical protein
MRGREASEPVRALDDADAWLDDLAALGEDVDLAFPLGHVDANMVHGWPLSSAALTAGCSCGAPCPHAKREATRFIPSSVWGLDESAGEPEALMKDGTMYKNELAA